MNRAGRFVVKRDANHGVIEQVFRQLLADHVTDSSRWEGGAGDLFVSFGKYSTFIEIKRDDKAKYTAHQVRFQNAHPHSVMRCESIEQAEKLCKLIRERAGRLA